MDAAAVFGELCKTHSKSRSSSVLAVDSPELPPHGSGSWTCPADTPEAGGHPPVWGGRDVVQRVGLGAAVGGLRFQEEPWLLSPALDAVVPVMTPPAQPHTPGASRKRGPEESLSSACPQPTRRQLTAVQVGAPAGAGSGSSSRGRAGGGRRGGVCSVGVGDGEAQGSELLGSFSSSCPGPLGPLGSLSDAHPGTWTDFCTHSSGPSLCHLYHLDHRGGVRTCAVLGGEGDLDYGICACLWQ